MKGLYQISDKDAGQFKSDCAAANVRVQFVGSKNGNSRFRVISGNENLLKPFDWHLFKDDGEVVYKSCRTELRKRILEKLNND